MRDGALIVLARADGGAPSFPVSKARAARLSGVKNASVRARSLACERALVRALSEFRIDPPADYAYGANGKPRLNVPGLYMSLSHAGGYGACALAAFEIGLDIEEEPRYDERLARRCLCEAELNDVLTSDDPARRFRYYWTAKESYGKLTGEGLARVCPQTRVTRTAAGDAWLWTGEAAGCAVALCASKASSVEIRVL